MKSQLGFLALGLGLGTAAGWMLKGDAAPAAPASIVAATKTERPALASGGGLADASDEAKLPTKRERPEKTDEPKVMRFSSSDGEMPPEMKEAFAKMEEQRKEARARKIDERLAALKSRLNLTPEQEAKVRALLEESSEMGLAGMPFFASKLAGDGKGGALSISGAVAGGGSDAEGGSLDDKLAALLSPEQKDSFAAFQQEQRENKVEIATNREMGQLQQQLTLTPEQKDQAFQALGDIARREAENPQKGFDPEAMQAARQSRLDALRPILTPEQMKAYESNPAMSFAIPEVTVMPGAATIHSVLPVPKPDK